jgi:hypothetical protein
MIKQVYIALKSESRRGDFHDQVAQDKKETNITFNEKEICDYTHNQWKTIVQSRVKELALRNLVEENSTKEKTKHIEFKELKMSEYLRKNTNSQISKIIFSIRSKTFDIKVWQEWKYNDNACVACGVNAEDMDHFLKCQAYENCPQEKNWKIILEDHPEQQVSIAKVAQKRMKYRLKLLEIEEAGLTL